MGFLDKMRHRKDEKKSHVSAEQNKAVAKNSQVTMGTRARAAKSFFSDKKTERSNKNKANLETHKMKA